MRGYVRTSYIGDVQGFDEEIRRPPWGHQAARNKLRKSHITVVLLSVVNIFIIKSIPVITGPVVCGSVACGSVICGSVVGGLVVIP